MNGNTFIDQFHDTAAPPRFSLYSWNRLKNVNEIIDTIHECQYIDWSISWYRRGATIFTVFMKSTEECKCNHWSISRMQMQSLIDFMISPRRHDFQCIHEKDWGMQMQSLIPFMNAIAIIDRFHDTAAAPRFSVYSWSGMKNANAIIDTFDECNCIHWSISWYSRGATIFTVFMK